MDTTAVPVDQLRWITIPKKNGEKGSQVQIFYDDVWPTESYRLGEVIRLNANLEENGRQAILIVRIMDPLALRAENAHKPPLLLNSYVRGKIDCSTLPQVVKIKRQYMQDGNNIWIMTPEKTLEIRPLQVLFKNQNEIIVEKGLEAGEHYITSTLTAPITEMLLQTKDEGLSRAKTKAEKK
ncbi:efflux RND transporter periplasmic adaptor subunit [Desulfotalea psychrophila]|uniref:hypothetical protein n=1 Tax=Desulfotalea psychrophila TaxID=84980 RepID=UPI0002FD239C|nr:hypothetical protein [Desulfotalea psychrophila]